jgi:hypothetical protein
MLAAGLFLLAYRYSEEVYIYSFYHPLPTFKFAGGGTYNFTFREVVGKNIHLALFDESSYARYVDGDPAQASCNGSDCLRIEDLTPLVGNVTSEMTVYPTVVASLRGLRFLVDMSLRNPDTALDMRLYPAVALNLAFCAVFLLIAVVFLFLIFKQLIAKQQVTFALVALIVLPALDHLLRFAELSRVSAYDADGGLTTAHRVSHLANYAMFAALFLIAVRGVSIISEELTRGVIGEIVFVSVFFVWTLLEFLSWGQLGILLDVFLFGVAFVAYAAEVYVSAGATSEQLSAMLIANDPLVATLTKKYNRLKGILAALVIVVVVNIFFRMIVGVEDWVQELLECFSELGLIAGFIWLYRDGGKLVYAEGVGATGEQLVIDDEGPDSAPRFAPLQPLLEGDTDLRTSSVDDR